MSDGVKQTMIDGVAKLCPKLKSLSINYTQFNAVNFVVLQEAFGNLNYLDLSMCGIDEDSLPVTLDGGKFSNIKTLKLSGNGSMKGSFFAKMIHVEVLDVSYCFELQFDEFFHFLNDCIKLIQLNVTASGKLVHGVVNFLEVLFAHQPEIEVLLMEKTGVVVDSDVVSKFDKLKEFTFEGRRFGT